jgi:hypothetical protein
MWAAQALKEWHDFYMLAGTAGATLLALLFVAVSCGVGWPRAGAVAPGLLHLWHQGAKSLLPH